MILQAAEQAHPEGTVGYLRHQAVENPNAFMSLLGRVLPMTVQGAGENGEHLISRIELVAMRDSRQD